MKIILFGLSPKNVTIVCTKIFKKSYFGVLFCSNSESVSVVWNKLWKKCEVFGCNYLKMSAFADMNIITV